MAANLLPELLLALVGYPGDAFASGDQIGIALVDAIDWVTPSEREQLNRLAQLGQHYAALEAFAEEAAAAGPEGGGAIDALGGLRHPPCSLYRLALASGVSELLDVYRGAMLQVEAHLLHPRILPPLLMMQQFLLEWEVLLPEAAALVHEVEARGLVGAATMYVLSLRAHSGMPAAQSCAQRLLWHCRQVLFEQLESWLVHGVLLDRAGDFFIQRTGGSAGQSAMYSGEPSAGSSNSGSIAPSPLGLADSGGVLGKAALLDWQPLEWHTGFQVSLGNLPPDISLTTAETVLFIGKAVRSLKQPMSSAASRQALHAHAEILGFSQALHVLQRAESFSAVHFEHCIEQLRAKVSGLLWDLVQNRCDLVGQFEAIRSYFLLGRGDFYQQFLNEALGLLTAEPTHNTAEADIAMAFQQSALKSTADTDPLFGAITLRWMPGQQLERPETEGGAPAWHPSRCTSIAVPGCDAWDGLFLECTVEWPLQLLFPPEVLSKYGATWQFMFRLRRVQRALEEAWVTLQALQRRKPVDDSLPRVPASLRAALMRERQRQHHFVSNFSLYLAMDMVGASFSQLQAAILSARDFNTADAAHRQFVDGLVSQAFLDVKQLMRHMEEMIKRCLELCALVQRVAEGNLAGVPESLKTVSKDFQVAQQVFLQKVQSGRMDQRAPAMRQLLTRLSFNNALVQVMAM